MKARQKKVDGKESGMVFNSQRRTHFDPQDPRRSGSTGRWFAVVDPERRPEVAGSSRYGQPGGMQVPAERATRPPERHDQNMR